MQWKTCICRLMKSASLEMQLSVLCQSWRHWTWTITIWESWSPTCSGLLKVYPLFNSLIKDWRKEGLPCKVGQLTPPTNIQVNPPAEFTGFETGSCAAAGKLLVNYKKALMVSSVWWENILLVGKWRTSEASIWQTMRLELLRVKHSTMCPNPWSHWNWITMKSVHYQPTCWTGPTIPTISSWMWRTILYSVTPTCVGWWKEKRMGGYGGLGLAR